MPDTEEARGYVFYHGQDADRAAAGGGLWLAYGSFGELSTAEVGEEAAAALRATGLLPWLPVGVSLKVEAGQHASVIHRQHPVELACDVLSRP